MRNFIKTIIPIYLCTFACLFSYTAISICLALLLIMLRGTEVNWINFPALIGYLAISSFPISAVIYLSFHYRCGGSRGKP